MVPEAALEGAVNECWGYLGWSTELDSGLPKSMADREELGSNLLRVFKSSPGGPGGSGSFGKGAVGSRRGSLTTLEPQLPLSDREMALAPDSLPSPATSQPVAQRAQRQRGTRAKPIPSPLIDRIREP
jgi:hypothetical protein